jgi:hypothetical protein
VFPGVNVLLYRVFLACPKPIRTFAKGEIEKRSA